MAPARVLLVSVANGAAVLWFIVAGAVRWPEALAMLIASRDRRLSRRAAWALAAGADHTRICRGIDRDGDGGIFRARDVTVNA